jgi:hypothetical protein
MYAKKWLPIFRLVEGPPGEARGSVLREQLWRLPRVSEFLKPQKRLWYGIEASGCGRGPVKGGKRYKPCKYAWAGLYGWKGSQIFDQILKEHNISKKRSIFRTRGI